jgi:predicted transglutaminase-like cysteine proteinase
LAAKSTTLDLNATAAFAPMGVFQSIELETNATTGMASWNKAKRQLSAEAASYKACDAGSSTCPAQLRNWRNMLGQWSKLSQRAKLIQVNRFANTAIAYTDDRKAFRSADYWATPLESLKGRGDCEDYVLLKYASLRSLGFAEDQLRIVIVKDLKAGLGHAVLSVKTAGGTFILDNQDNRVLRHDSIVRYAPVYSVNAKGRWINIATRDLKKRKIAPVVLVASARELGEVLPALGKLNMGSLPTKRARLSATGAIALMNVPEVSQVISKPAATLFEKWAGYLIPIAALLASAMG